MTFSSHYVTKSLVNDLLACFDMTHSTFILFDSSELPKQEHDSTDAKKGDRRVKF